jgi:hypothetical protein
VGSALSTFTDFVQSTGPAFLTSAEDVVNEAVKNKYVLGRFLRNQPMSRVLQGGRVIRDEIMFDDQSTFTPYQPNDVFTWENPQVLTEWEINWRFYADHMAFTDHEVELNTGGGLSSKARHQAFKRLKRVKEQRLWTSMLNGMEDLLSAVPTNASMEAAGGTAAYSIPAFINEETNGMYGGFSTVMGINGDTESKWRNQAVTYGETAVDDTNNIVSKFDEMWLKIRFEPPPTREMYFENLNFSSQFILTSRKGINVYKQLLRKSQDTFVTTSRQDPDYNAPKYSGIDLVYWSNLDTATLYTDGTVDQYDGSHKGPRYYWINSQYMSPVFHTSRYMHMHSVKEHPNQPFTHIRPVDSWMNLVCRSRQRQGIVSPSGSVYATENA